MLTNTSFAGSTLRPTPELANDGWVVVDADMLHRERLAHELRSVVSQPVVTLHSLEQADPQMSFDAPAFVLCPKLANTTSLVRDLRSQYGRATIVLIGYLSAMSAFEAAQAGADAFVPKPVTGAQIRDLVMGSTVSAPLRAELPSLARAEWEYLQSVLTWCDGNRSEAARRLGIHRSVLQRKLSRNPPVR